jgi:hypothetical protein
VHGAGSAADPVKFSTIYARNCNSGGTNSGDRCVNPSTPNPLPGAGDILAGDILNIDPNAVLITGDDPFPATDILAIPLCVFGSRKASSQRTPDC